MEPAQKFILFDFDGVIADSFALAFDVARITHPETNLTPEMYREWFEGNVYESIRKSVHGGNRNEAYFNTFAPRMRREVQLVFEMHNIVKKLAGTYTLAIISSTYTSLIQEFLERHALSEYFVDVLGGDVHQSKVEKIRMIFEKHQVVSDDCVFITDTLGDMKEAKEQGVGAIGVSWGWHNRETLEKGIPFRIVDVTRELCDAIDDYFAR